MAIAQQSRLDVALEEFGTDDFTPSLGYSGFAILLLIAIFWATKCCGTTPGDLALMTVLP